jgi:hypothetical protein
MRQLNLYVLLFVWLLSQPPVYANPVTNDNTPDSIRKINEQKNYSNFSYISRKAISQSDVSKHNLLLGEGSYMVDNPIIIDESNPVVFIHGVDRMRSVLIPINKDKPLLIVRGARYVNITNINFSGFNQNAGVNMKVEGQRKIVVDVIDSFIEKGTFAFEAPGSYQLQGNFFTGQGKVASQIVLNNRNADLFVMGGNMTNSGIELGPDINDYAHVHVKAGRFRIFATGVQLTKGVADFRIDSPAPAGWPHQILNVRSEGNNGCTPLSSAFVYVPHSSEAIDVDIVNSAGSWVLSGINNSVFAKYNATGTLRLVGNTSVQGAGAFTSQGTPTEYKLIAVANSLSQSPQFKSNDTDSENLHHAYNFYANKGTPGSSVKAPYFKMYLNSTEPLQDFPFLLNIDIPRILSRPAIASPLPGMLDVKKFGAKGDGCTDDTAAIQRAFDSGPSIYFPAGDYRISQSLKYNSNKLFSHGAGGFIAGAGSGLVTVDRHNGGDVFETQGMAYATIQGIAFKSKRASGTTRDSSTAMNFEFTTGVGHATQSNSIYDVAITEVNTGVAIGNKSQQQCSENIFINISVRNVDMAVSIGSYNALANVFVNFKTDNVETAVGHGGLYSGGTWSIVGADFSGVNHNVFNLLNASDGVFFFDQITVNNTPLFATNDTGAPFNLFFNKSALANTGFYLKSAGGVFLNNTELKNFKASSHGAMAENYVINNTRYRIKSEASTGKGSVFSGL